MQLTNTFTVDTAPDEVWKALLDAERVAPCMPGATIEEVVDNDVTGSMRVKLGPMSLTYRGTVSYVEVDQAHNRAVLAARAKDSKGGGSADATVAVQVVPEGSTTTVEVRTDLHITGRPAQFGRGVIEDVGSRVFDQFADNLAQLLTQEPGSEASTTPAPVLAELDGLSVVLPVLRRRVLPVVAAAGLVAVAVVLWRRSR